MNLPEDTSNSKSRNGMSHISIVIIAASITVLVLGIIGTFWVMQNPLAGMFGDTSSTVESTQSTEWTGPTIPNYLGMTYEEASKAAESDSSITLYRNYTDEYSDEYEEGKIMSQSPAAGSKLTQEDGILISVTVSKGSQMRELPKIEGSSIEQAASDIAEKGLLATPEYQYSDKYAEGRVVGYKDHQAGDTVEYGSNVTVIISKGQKQSESSSVG